MLNGVDPRKFDVYLTFESPVKTANAIGENEISWTTYGNCFGQREWRRSMEAIEARGVVGNDLVDYRVRYDSGITTLMRFKQVNETTYFYIRDVQHWQREGYTLITAERRDNQ